MTPLDRFAGRVFDLVVELSPWLLLGAVLVGLARALAPPRLAAVVVGQPGSATRVVRGPLLDPIAWLVTAGLLGWWFLGATLASGALLTLAMTLLATKGSPEPASQADATAGRRTVRASFRPRRLRAAGRHQRSRRVARRAAGRGLPRLYGARR